MNNSCAVVIPTHNRKEQLRHVLICLRKQRLSNISLLPIVIVDGSTDGTLEMLSSEFPEVKAIVGDGSLWYTRSINKGIYEAKKNETKYILTFNDDLHIDNTYIQDLFSCAFQFNSHFLIGSVSFTASMPHKVTFSGIKSIDRVRLKERPYLPKFSTVQPESISGIHPSCNLSGRGMLFPTALLELIGIFDEQFPQYGSDTDFSYRAYLAKIPVLVCFDAKVYEYEKLTSKGAAYNHPTFSEFMFSVANKHSVNSLTKSLRYYKKHGFKLLLPLYIIYCILGAAYTYFFKYRNK